MWRGYRRREQGARSPSFAPRKLGATAGKKEQGVGRKGIREIRGTNKVVARIALLLRRLLQGEESHAEIYDLIQNCRIYLDEANTIGEEVISSIESLTVARILYWLGYIGHIQGFGDDIKSTEITDSLVEKVLANKTMLNQHINKALHESQL